MSLQDIEGPIGHIYEQFNTFKSKYDTDYLGIIKFLTANLIAGDIALNKQQIKALTPIIKELKNGFRGQETFYSFIINEIYRILIIIHDKLKSYNEQADITDKMCQDLVKINSLKQKLNELIRELNTLKDNVRGIDNIVNKLFTSKGLDASVVQVIKNQQKLITEHEQSLPQYNMTLLTKITEPINKIDEFLVLIQKKCGSRVRYTNGKLMDVLQFSAQDGLLGSSNTQMLLMSLCKSTNYKDPIGLEVWKSIVASEKDGDDTMLMRAVKNHKLGKIQLLKTFPRLNPLITTKNNSNNIIRIDWIIINMKKYLRIKILFIFILYAKIIVITIKKNLMELNNIASVKKIE